MTPDGDRTATPLVEFAGLYQAHARDLRRFAVYLSGDAALADDFVSEAFVRLWTARARVEFATVRGYLFVIVRNLFLQHLRRERRRAPLVEDIADDRPGPEDRASDRSELGVVVAALATLPQLDRTAVLMRADEGLSYEEIAAALGISTAAAAPSVETQALRRTRRELRLRAVLLGVAIYVSTLPLTVTFNSSGFRGLLIEDWPERIVVMVLAVVLWAVYFGLRRRLRVSGL